jgi:plastocyanin
MTEPTEERESVPADSGHGRPRWSRLAAIGLLLAAAAPLLIAVASLITGSSGEDMGFFFVTAAIGIVGAFLVWRFGTWASVLGVVAALLMGMALFWTVFSLSYVSSFVDFTTGVLLPLGVLVAVVAGIASIVRRRTRTPRAEGAERRAIQVVLAIVAVVALVSGVLNLTGRESVAEDADADLVVRMREFEFDKEAYRADAGTTTVLVRNSDAFAHTFTIDEVDVDETIIPGSAKLIEVDATAGTYTLYCIPHTSDPDDPEDNDMAADFVVRG